MQILKFYAPWCNPCNQVSDIVKEVCDELNIELIEFDIELDQNEVLEMNVKTIPTLILVDHKKTELTRLVGVQTKSDMLDAFSTLVETNKVG